MSDVPPHHPVYGRWWVKLLAGVAMAGFAVGCALPAGWAWISDGNALLARLAAVIGPWPSAALFSLLAVGFFFSGVRQLRTEVLPRQESSHG